jgi:flagellar protein FlbD
MIRLTRLNQQPLAVNSDLIKFVEQAHDTVLTLINGDKVVVRENVDQVLERIIQFRHSILAGAGPTASNAAATALAVLSACSQSGTDR